MLRPSWNILFRSILPWKSSGWLSVPQPFPAPAASTSSETPPREATTAAHLAENYGRLPLSFEANHGQAPKSVCFLARGQGYGLYLTSEGAVLTLHKPEAVGSRAFPAHGTLRPLP